jgi:Na+/phosphate symporter
LQIEAPVGTHLRHRHEIIAMGSLVLLDLMGGVALLLWGLHMVLTGVLRAFGPNLRRFLDKALRNRFTAFVAGLGLTALLPRTRGPM